MGLCRRFLTGIILTQLYVYHVESHGRLMKPPGRGSAFRVIKDQGLVPNYNDMAQFCGGTQVQWKQNGGKCGACGDDFGAKRKEHEDLDGKFVVKSIIVGTYIAGEILTTEVDITAYHKGWFEFRLCKLEGTNRDTKVTQECLDKNLLTVYETGTTRVDLETVKTGNGRQWFTTKLKLPDDLVCDYCVLQWWYKTGNGGNSIEQETFVNCADIRIVGNNGELSGTSGGTPGSNGGTSGTNGGISGTNGGTSASNPGGNNPGNSGYNGDKDWGLEYPQQTPAPASQTPRPARPPGNSKNKTKPKKKPKKNRGKNKKKKPKKNGRKKVSKHTQNPKYRSGTCKPFSVGMKCDLTAYCYSSEGPYEALPGLPQWCCNNCPRGYCPASHCCCFEI